MRATASGWASRVIDEGREVARAVLERCRSDPDAAQFQLLAEGDAASVSSGVFGETAVARMEQSAIAPGRGPAGGQDGPASRQAKGPPRARSGARAWTDTLGSEARDAEASLRNESTRSVSSPFLRLLAPGDEAARRQPSPLAVTAMGVPPSIADAGDSATASDLGRDLGAALERAEQGRAGETGQLALASTGRQREALLAALGVDDASVSRMSKAGLRESVAELRGHLERSEALLQLYQTAYVNDVWRIREHLFRKRERARARAGDAAAKPEASAQRGARGRGAGAGAGSDSAPSQGAVSAEGGPATERGEAARAPIPPTQGPRSSSGGGAHAAQGTASTRARGDGDDGDDAASQGSVDSRTMQLHGDASPPGHGAHRGRPERWAPAFSLAMPSSVQLRQVLRVFGLDSDSVPVPREEFEHLQAEAQEAAELRVRVAALRGQARALADRHARLTTSARSLAGSLDDTGTSEAVSALEAVALRRRLRAAQGALSEAAGALLEERARGAEAVEALKAERRQGAGRAAQLDAAEDELAAARATLAAAGEAIAKRDHALAESLRAQRALQGQVAAATRSVEALEQEKQEARAQATRGRELAVVNQMQAEAAKGESEALLQQVEAWKSRALEAERALSVARAAAEPPQSQQAEEPPLPQPQSANPAKQEDGQRAATSQQPQGAGEPVGMQRVPVFDDSVSPPPAMPAASGALPAAERSPDEERARGAPGPPPRPKAHPDRPARPAPATSPRPSSSARNGHEQPSAQAAARAGPADAAVARPERSCTVAAPQQEALHGAHAATPSTPEGEDGESHHDEVEPLPTQPQREPAEPAPDGRAAAQLRAAQEEAARLRAALAAAHAELSCVREQLRASPGHLRDSAGHTERSDAAQPSLLSERASPEPGRSERASPEPGRSERASPEPGRSEQGPAEFLRTEGERSNVNSSSAGGDAPEAGVSAGGTAVLLDNGRTGAGPDSAAPAAATAGLEPSPAAAAEAVQAAPRDLGSLVGSPARARRRLSVDVRTPGSGPVGEGWTMPARSLGAEVAATPTQELHTALHAHRGGSESRPRRAAPFGWESRRGHEASVLPARLARLSAGHLAAPGLREANFGLAVGEVVPARSMGRASKAVQTLPVDDVTPEQAAGATQAATLRRRAREEAVAALAQARQRPPSRQRQNAPPARATEATLPQLSAAAPPTATAQCGTQASVATASVGTMLSGPLQLGTAADFALQAPADLDPAYAAVGGGLPDTVPLCHARLRSLEQELIRVSLGFQAADSAMRERTGLLEALAQVRAALAAAKAAKRAAELEGERAAAELGEQRLSVQRIEGELRRSQAVGTAWALRALRNACGAGEAARLLAQQRAATAREEGLRARQSAAAERAAAELRAGEREAREEAERMAAAAAKAAAQVEEERALAQASAADSVKQAVYGARSEVFGLSEQAERAAERVAAAAGAEVTTPGVAAERPSSASGGGASGALADLSGPLESLRRALQGLEAAGMGAAARMGEAREEAASARAAAEQAQAQASAARAEAEAAAAASSAAEAAEAGEGGRGDGSPDGPGGDGEFCASDGAAGGTGAGSANARSGAAGARRGTEGPAEAALEAAEQRVAALEAKCLELESRPPTASVGVQTLLALGRADGSRSRLRSGGRAGSSGLGSAKFGLAGTVGRRGSRRGSMPGRPEAPEEAAPTMGLFGQGHTEWRVALPADYGTSAVRPVLTSSERRAATAAVAVRSAGKSLRGAQASRAGSMRMPRASAPRRHSVDTGSVPLHARSTASLKPAATGELLRPRPAATNAHASMRVQRGDGLAAPSPLQASSPGHPGGGHRRGAPSRSDSRVSSNAGSSFRVAAYTDDSFAEAVEVTSPSGLEQRSVSPIAAPVAVRPFSASSGSGSGSDEPAPKGQSPRPWGRSPQAAASQPATSLPEQRGGTSPAGAGSPAKAAAPSSSERSARAGSPAKAASAAEAAPLPTRGEAPGASRRGSSREPSSSAAAGATLRQAAARSESPLAGGSAAMPAPSPLRGRSSAGLGGGGRGGSSTSAGRLQSLHSAMAPRGGAWRRRKGDASGAALESAKRLMSAPSLAPAALPVARRGPQARARHPDSAAQGELPSTAPGKPPSQRAQALAAAGAARIGGLGVERREGGQGLDAFASPRWRGEGPHAAAGAAAAAAAGESGASLRPSTVGGVGRQSSGRGAGNQLPGIAKRRLAGSRGDKGKAGSAAGADGSRAASGLAGLSQASATSLESSAYAALWDVGIHLPAREPADNRVQVGGPQRSGSRGAGTVRRGDAAKTPDRWSGGRSRGPRMTGRSRGTASAAQLEAASRARTPLVGVPWTGSDTDLPPLRGAETVAWSVAIAPEHTHRKGWGAPRDAPAYGGESKAVS